jgi:hypothetical protein
MNREEVGCSVTLLRATCVPYVWACGCPSGVGCCYV